MKSRSMLALAVFVPFTAFSVWVAARHSALGFLSLIPEGGWQTQVFVDLVIALAVASTVVHADARRRGINPWPWMLSMLALGSVGMLAYFVAREFLGRREEPAQAAPR